MSVTVSVYNHTAAKLWDLSVAANAGNFYVALLTNSAVFDAAHTTKSQVDNVGAYEVYGNGWTQGGVALSGVSVSTSLDVSKLDAAGVSVTASGGSIGPAYNALLYIDENGAGTTKTPLLFIAFNEAKMASEGNSFNIAWDADGIYTIAPAT